MSKIRVAHLVNVIGPSGKESGILKIASRMDQVRFKIDIVSLSGILYRDAVPHLDQFDILTLKSTPEGNNLKLIPQLANLLRKKKYDIVYTHSWNTLLEGYFSSFMARVPVKIHGEHGTFERSFAKDRVQKFFWGRFDRIIVVADALQKKMRKEFGYKKENIVVRHNGVDIQKFYPSEKYRKQVRKEFGLENTFVIGNVGRFFPVKDHFTLFRAFEAVRAKIPRTKLMLVGADQFGGNLKQKYVKYLKQKSLIDDVLILPPTGTVERMFNAMDVFVLSSISEGCSNVILEALACGVPVIATKTGGNPELLGNDENGLLFPVGDDRMLAQHLLLLYQDLNLREKLSHIGPRVIKQKFTIERVANFYEKLFQDLLSSKKHH